jgi:hypothetical protein
MFASPLSIIVSPAIPLLSNKAPTKFDVFRVDMSTFLQTCSP